MDRHQQELGLPTTGSMDCCTRTYPASLSLLWPCTRQDSTPYVVLGQRRRRRRQKESRFFQKKAKERKTEEKKRTERKIEEKERRGEEERKTPGNEQNICQRARLAAPVNSSMVEKTHFNPPGSCPAFVGDEGEGAIQHPSRIPGKRPDERVVLPTRSLAPPSRM